MTLRPYWDSMHRPYLNASTLTHEYRWQTNTPRVTLARTPGRASLINECWGGADRCSPGAFIKSTLATSTSSVHVCWSAEGMWKQWLSCWRRPCVYLVATDTWNGTKRCSWNMLKVFVGLATHAQINKWMIVRIILPSRLASIYFSDLAKENNSGLWTLA